MKIKANCQLCKSKIDGDEVATLTDHEIVSMIIIHDKIVLELIDSRCDGMYCLQLPVKVMIPANHITKKI